MCSITFTIHLSFYIRITLTQVGYLSSLDYEFLRRTVAIEAGHPRDIDRAWRDPFNPRSHDVDRWKGQFDHAQTSRSRFIATRRHYGACVLPYIGSSNDVDFESAVRPHFHPLTRLRIYYSVTTSHFKIFKQWNNYRI